MNGELFIDGSSSGDVIQGKLGDCWFLGALAVLGTREDLLAKCFWRLETFKEFGLFVCVFYKDCALRYVIIDDRIPVFANSGKVVFAQCKDPNVSEECNVSGDSGTFQRSSLLILLEVDDRPRSRCVWKAPAHSDLFTMDYLYGLWTIPDLDSPYYGL